MFSVSQQGEDKKRNHTLAQVHHMYKGENAKKELGKRPLKFNDIQAICCKASRVFEYEFY